jgi:hypothetical protein
MPSTRHTTELLQRRHEVATRYLHGEQQYHIARAMGVSQSQISLDLKAIRAMWLASLVRDFDAMKSVELAKIDECERQFWSGWQRSLQPREVTLTEATEGEKPTRKASVRKEGQAGDPRFLDGVLRCVQQRCKILGLDVESQALKEMSTGMADLLAQARSDQGTPQAPMAEA